jgi:hypothetical protein
MTQALPEPPTANERVLDSSGKLTIEFYRFFNQLVNVLRVRLSITGTATFAAGTTIAVVLDNELPNTDYRVAVEATENNTFWITSKATTGFTINAASSSSATVGWVLTRD